MAKFANGFYEPKKPEKYIGKKKPHYRSSWELTMMRFLDDNPSILQWASEAIHISYINPFTKKKTIYVPDFLVIYQDKDGVTHGEIVEIKPSKETTMEAAKSARDKAAVVLNHCKWQAAATFCQQNGLKFRVINENQIFAGTK
jgi:hypothetical protein